MTDGSESGETSDQTSTTKVERVIDQYELAGLGEELEARWLGESRTKQSLRDLEAYLNKRLLESAIIDSEQPLVDGEIDNLYRLLTNEETSRAARTEAESKLDRLGVDVDQVRRDFVSHQSVHSYLTEVRGVSHSADDKPSQTVIQNRQDTIQRVQNRLVVLAEQTLDSLEKADHLELGAVDVMANLTVYCNDCDSSYTFSEILNESGCSCQLSDQQ